MSHEQESIFFGCTQCGKCCDTGPTFHLGEIMQFSKQFIIGVRPELIALDHAKMGEHGKQTLELVKKSAFHFEADGKTFAVMLHVEDVGYNAYVGPCEMLGEDKRCAIMGQRPLQCSTTPFSPVNPESLQMNVMNHFTRLGCASKTPSEQRVLIYRQGEIQDAHYKDLFTQSQDKMLEFGQVLFHAGSQIAATKNLGGNISLDMLWEAGRKKQIIRLPLTYILLSMYGMGKISTDDIKEVVANQVELLHRKIDEVKFNKVKQLRPITKVLEGYLSMYSRFEKHIDAMQDAEFIDAANKEFEAMENEQIIQPS